MEAWVLHRQKRLNRIIDFALLFVFAPIFFSLSFLNVSLAGVLVLVMAQLTSDAWVESFHKEVQETVWERLKWKVMKASPLLLVWVVMIVTLESNGRKVEDPWQTFMVGGSLLFTTFHHIRTNHSEIVSEHALQEKQKRMASLLLTIAVVFFTVLYSLVMWISQ